MQADKVNLELDKNEYHGGKINNGITSVSLLCTRSQKRIKET